MKKLFNLSEPHFLILHNIRMSCRLCKYQEAISLVPEALEASLKGNSCCTLISHGTKYGQSAYLRESINTSVITII